MTTARAMTASELVAMRSDGQLSRVKAIFIPQQIVCTAQVSTAIANGDSVTDIPITVLNGSVYAVRNGMTGYVGSTAGGDDLGMVRVKSANATNIHVARVSGITWTTSVYITIVDDFGLWAKLPTLDLTTIRMDDDVTYTNQNTYFTPTPIFGPDRAINVTSGSVGLDGTASYCLDGSAITSYSWGVYNGSAVSGSIVISGSGTATWLIPGAGSYIMELTVTAANGKSCTGHRNYYVYDNGTYAPIDQISLDSLSGSRRDGGWSANIKVYAGMSGSSVRDRPKVILISDDYYGGSAGGMGQIAGSEGTLMVGWATDETTDYDIEQNVTAFSIQGPAYWLQQCTGPSTYLENVTTTPTIWTSMVGLTMDKIIHHFFYWRSTAMEVMDIYRCLNTRGIPGMSASIGNIWDQVKDTAETRMLTYLECNRYGQFLPYVDPQILLAADRTSIPTVMGITKDDIIGKISIKRTLVNPVSLLEVAGLCPNGSDADMFMSRAPGSLIYQRFGQNDTNDRLVVSSQDDANNLSGLLLAKKNSMYSSINIELGENNRMIDIAPAMYVTLSATASETGRFNFTNKKCLIDHVSLKFDNEKGFFIVDKLELEGETIGSAGYTVEVPQEPIAALPSIPGITNYPIIPDVVITPVPPSVIPQTPNISGSAVSGSACTGSVTNGPFQVFFYPNSGGQYIGDIGSGYGQSSNGYYPCYVRKSSAAYKTYLHFTGYLEIAASGSSGWGPCTNDVIPFEIRAYNTSGSYVVADTVEWVLPPSINNGTFSADAWFNSLPANWKTSYFQMYINLAPVPTNVNMGACMPTAYKNAVSGNITNLPTSGSIIAGYQSQPDMYIGAAQGVVWKFNVSGSGLGAGTLKFYEKHTMIQGVSGTFPSKVRIDHYDTSTWPGVPPDTGYYSPCVGIAAAYVEDFAVNPNYKSVSGYLTLSPGTYFFSMADDIYGLGSQGNSFNIVKREIYRITFTVGAVETDLYTGGHRRVTINTTKLYNICI